MNNCLTTENDVVSLSFEVSRNHHKLLSKCKQEKLLAKPVIAQNCFLSVVSCYPQMINAALPSILLSFLLLRDE